jgi:hypothetical protein
VSQFFLLVFLLAFLLLVAIAFNRLRAWMEYREELRHARFHREMAAEAARMLGCHKDQVPERVLPDLHTDIRNEPMKRRL